MLVILVNKQLPVCFVMKICIRVKWWIACFNKEMWFIYILRPDGIFNFSIMLANKTDRRILKEQLQKEEFNRKTISFYKYFDILNPQQFRDELFIQWSELGCFGRIYVAREGINAQMSVPEHNFEAFLKYLYSIPQLNEVPVKQAIEDDGKSFYKLTIKVDRKSVV